MREGSLASLLAVWSSSVGPRSMPLVLKRMLAGRVGGNTFAADEF